MDYVGNTSLNDFKMHNIFRVFEMKKYKTKKCRVRLNNIGQHPHYKFKLISLQLPKLKISCKRCAFFKTLEMSTEGCVCLNVKYIICPVIRLEHILKVYICPL